MKLAARSSFVSAALAGFAAFALSCAPTGGVDGGPPCGARDLGSRTGGLLVRGTTRDGTNSNSPSCSTGSSPDVAFTWQAPSAGAYVFSTAGSEYDTVISVRSDTCVGSELACNDDFNGDRTSTVTVTVTVGQTVAILVDGFNNASGNYVLSITRQ